MNLKTKKVVDYYVGGFLIALFRPFVFVAGKILHRPHDIRPTGRIVVLKFMGGGSLVLAFPALLGIRRQYPQRQMELICTAAVAPFAETLHLFDRISIIDDTSWAPLVLSSFGTIIRSMGADTLLDLEVYSRLSTIFGLLTLARNRAGFYMESSFWRKFLYTHLFYFNRFALVSDFYNQMAYHLNATPAPLPICSDHLRQTLSLKERPAAGPLEIVIAPGSSENGRERQLSPAQWEAVARRRLLPGKSAHIVLLGGPGDRALVESILNRLPLEAPPGTTFENACGTGTLQEAVARLAQCDEFWGIDSSLLHLARLLGRPSVSYWGPTDPSTRLAPMPGLKEEVFYEKIICSPCIHVTEHPPCDGDNRCIQRLFDSSVRVDGTDTTFTSWPGRT